MRAIFLLVIAAIFFLIAITSFVPPPLPSVSQPARSSSPVAPATPVTTPSITPPTEPTSMPAPRSQVPNESPGSIKASQPRVREPRVVGGALYEMLRDQHLSRIAELREEAERPGRSAAAKAKLRKLERGEEIYIPILQPPFRPGMIGLLPAFPATVLNVIGESELLVGWDSGDTLVPFWLVGYDNSSVASGQSVAVGGHLVAVKQPVDYPAIFGSKRAIQLQFVDADIAKSLREELREEFRQELAENREAAAQKRSNADPSKLAESRLNLAKSLHSKGNIQGAREFLESLIQKYPVTAQAKVAKEMLKSPEYQLPASIR